MIKAAAAHFELEESIGLYTQLTVDKEEQL